MGRYNDELLERKKEELRDLKIEFRTLTVPATGQRPGPGHVFQRRGRRTGPEKRHPQRRALGPGGPGTRPLHRLYLAPAVHHQRRARRRAEPGQRPGGQDAAALCGWWIEPPPRRAFSVSPLKGRCLRPGTTGPTPRHAFSVSPLKGRCLRPGKASSAASRVHPAPRFQHVTPQGAMPCSLAKPVPRHPRSENRSPATCRAFPPRTRKRRVALCSATRREMSSPSDHGGTGFAGPHVMPP